MILQVPPSSDSVHSSSSISLGEMHVDKNLEKVFYIYHWSCVKEGTLNIGLLRILREL